MTWHSKLYGLHVFDSITVDEERGYFWAFVGCCLLLVTVFPSIPALAIDPPGQLVVVDPPWYDEPSDHNTFPPADLTEVRITNGRDEIFIEIPFQSDWDGMQLHVLIETNFDPDGAGADAFEQPVYFNHVYKPDYAITCKYSFNDYADFRRWNVGLWQWEYFDPATETYTTTPTDGNINGLWTTKGSDSYFLNIPWSPFGGIPDSFMIEVYLTQDDGIKRSAFDSVPPDNTLDLDFDYENPQPGDWDIAVGPVYLASWSPAYQVVTDFPATPQVTGVAVAPLVMQSGGDFSLMAEVLDGGDGVGQVSADLSAVGGAVDEPLYDDGNPSHGDLVGGDGIFSLMADVPPNWFPGTYELEVKAYGTDLVNYTSDVCTIAVLHGSPILDAEDVVGDDHGPNQLGTARMFYTYPSNTAFVPGGFDLTSLTVFETVANVGGQEVEMIAFEVGLADFPDPDDPGNANWNPLYADLNIQKIDILIDNAPGGATATLPGRQAALQPWDAWDHAIIIAGWYKALIPSLGQNTVDAWRANALRADHDILLLSDPVADTVTAFVSKAALGNPTPEDIRKWDIAVCLAGKDAGGEEVLGGIRWVNEWSSEWQFGGGNIGNRDSNYLDLLLVPGIEHVAGRPQEELLDYESPEAWDRLAQGLTPVALEMTEPGGAGVTPIGVTTYCLGQNSPNPFNPQTTIAYDLPKQAAVSLRVFDMSGRLVRVLVDGEVVAEGRQEAIWNGRDDTGRRVASGTYFYRLEAGEYSETRRMALVK